MASTKKLKDLVEEAATLSDSGTYANKTWVNWFNNGLDDLSDTLYMDKKITITMLDGKFALPQDLLAITMVDGVLKNLQQLDPQDNVSIGYKIVGEDLYLQNDAAQSIDMLYYRRPTYLSTEDADTTVDIPSNAVRALVLYGCMQAMIQDDESERYSIFVEEYNKARLSVQRANRAKRPSRIGQWEVIS